MTNQSSHIRVINLTVDPNRVGELQSRLGEVGDRVAGITGVLRWTAAIDRSTGAMVAIAEYDSAANADAAGPIHQQVLSDFGEFFTTPPQIAVYEVIGALAGV